MCVRLTVSVRRVIVVRKTDSEVRMWSKFVVQPVHTGLELFAAHTFQASGQPCIPNVADQES